LYLANRAADEQAADTTGLKPAPSV